MTLTLRARLAVIATIVSGLLLGGLSVVSYNVLARWLDEDVTTRLTELTDGLHGYLRFDGDAPTVEYNMNDSDQASFVHEATRYYQVYDSATGRLLVQSPDIAPLGLSLTRGEIVLLLATSQPSDITTPYGRLRIVNSPIAGPGGRTYLLQVGVSLRTLDASLSRYRDLMLVLTPLSLLLAVRLCPRSVDARRLRRARHRHRHTGTPASDSWREGRTRRRDAGLQRDARPARTVDW